MTTTPSVLVVDSNLIISVLNADDVHNAEVTKLFKSINQGHFQIVAPALYLWEQEAYLQHPDKVKTHVQSQAIPSFMIGAEDVTADLFWQTRSPAMTYITGADRVFVSLAKKYNAPLITNDKRILKHAAALGVKAISVKDFLASAQP